MAHLLAASMATLVPRSRSSSTTPRASRSRTRHVTVSTGHCIFCSRPCRALVVAARHGQHLGTRICCMSFCARGGLHCPVNIAPAEGKACKGTLGRTFKSLRTGFRRHTVLAIPPRVPENM
ncbi:hypothetical protein EDB85DRAFT_1007087 [Lactarius pseudohatsudake]|nr:hypothetical protein EDB85DRAFT_1007087 [Lactarius pseudohatsudake]